MNCSKVLLFCLYLRFKQDKFMNFNFKTSLVYNTVLEKIFYSGNTKNSLNTTSAPFERKNILKKLSFNTQKRSPIRIFMFLLVVLFADSCKKAEVNDSKKPLFSFAFLTDIHLTPERKALQGFDLAIDTLNKLNIDFVITGGDLIMDALAENADTANMLYDMYLSASKKIDVPVYNTMGNHEVFGLYKESGVDPSHSDYAEKLYERRIGKRYYSFDHKGWHFVVVDAIGENSERRYYGYVDSMQMEWIKQDLSKVSSKTPIVISTHIPFVSVWGQLSFGTMQANHPADLITNSKEVLELFKEHNLKLVLQGHLHFLEDVFANDVHFITGGAVSSRWWQGKNNGLEEGFLKIDVFENSFQWHYIDYGWNGEIQSPE